MEQIIMDFPVEYKVKCRIFGDEKEFAFAEICEGLETFVDKEILPGKIFLMKNGKCYFEIEKEKGMIWCKYDLVWNVFWCKFGLEYNEIKAFIKVQVEEHFKLKGLTPMNSRAIFLEWVEEHFRIS